ncbi:FAD-linked oxidase [Novosphingobium sp. AAP83]|uniref:FAD-binding oxidoreductase n=1 Tax=Novosphingobium sp. AAP83 TaxID=1523425 RepID=UPI0006B95E58|nr:FAD-binding oxidoreductase [Novosphingobium sp. AAP83]KPF91590.1 FAD-linked oxidase [Novosphingobium sp. AAP83]
MTLAAALQDFAAIVGTENVFNSDQDRNAYADHFAQDPETHLPIAAVAPTSRDQVRDIVRVANRHKVALWPISRGKNFGYGGAAPVMKGSVVLDLSRLKAIDFDEANGVVLVEPGVSFFDLHDFLQARKAPYWLSVPGNSWGSVAGNALDRGVGYTPYGDHASRICGLEVVLPDGDLIRTGMGAMDGSPTWNLYRNGFGPGWDTMFCQSNFGVVTRLGLWLMPEPEALAGYDLEFDKPEDLGWAIDTIMPLRRSGLIQQSPSIGNWLRSAAVMTRREEWTSDKGPLSETVVSAIRKRFNIGWWSVQIRFYGPQEVVDASLRALDRAFDGKPLLSKKLARWKQGDGPEGSPMSGVPVSFPLANANWHGGRGGHIGYSPVLPPSGDLALKQFQRTYALYQKYEMDYHASFAMGERSLTNVNQILYNKDDAPMMARVDGMFRDLVADASAQRYGEYRTHIDYMELVASTYDFNDRALLRLNERVKQALDPNGIIAPGKSGIWTKGARS